MFSFKGDLLNILMLLGATMCYDVCLRSNPSVRHVDFRYNPESYVDCPFQEKCWRKWALCQNRTSRRDSGSRKRCNNDYRNFWNCLGMRYWDKLDRKAILQHF